jgi:selT/selW/selH-like putative selenoprotein
VSLKNDLEREFHVPIRLKMGAPGALDVSCNGEEVYSKKRTGRLPTAAELIPLIRAKLPASV